MGYIYNQKNLDNYPYLFSFYDIYLLLFLDFWVKLDQINLDFIVYLKIYNLIKTKQLK